MRRIALLGISALSTFGVLVAGAPAAHADTTVGESVTVTIPDSRPTGLVLCLTVRELNTGTHCVPIL